MGCSAEDERNIPRASQFTFCVVEWLMKRDSLPNFVASIVVTLSESPNI